MYKISSPMQWCDDIKLIDKDNPVASIVGTIFGFAFLALIIWLCWV